MLASGMPVLMRVLAVDTASPSPALALLWGDGDRAAGVGIEPLPEHAAESLVTRLRALGERSGMDPRSVERVAVLAGPGSFTGLRAGAAFARGFARALGVPLVSRSTFEAASAALALAGDADLLLDAGRGEVHRARLRAGRITEDPAPLRRAGALEEADRQRVAVRDLTQEPLVLAPALARLAAGAPAPAGGMKPVYGRPSAAEEKLPESAAS